MEVKELLVNLSSLIHDVGKLLERGNVFQEVRKDSFYLEMCPKAKDGDYFTHLHSAHTRRFCDWLEEHFSCLRELQDKDWKTWASAHHKNDETSLEASVIRRADRLSSREREEGAFKKRQIHKKTYLEPVLERVFLESNDKLATEWRYPINTLSRKKECLFPLHYTELGLQRQEGAEGRIKDPDSWEHLLASKTLDVEYSQLAENFLYELEKLSNNNPAINLMNLINTVYSLLEIYTANVPSATNVRHPDISLFDHLRTTAAIAQALYLHQKYEKNGKTVHLETEQDSKWILACGDFSGIQKFIYNLTNKGAAKGLRGRSFYVQHFCQLSAEYIIRSLDLCKTSLIYNSGGKFYLLLPKHLLTELQTARKDINSWLLESFSGEVYLGLGWTEVTAEMFIQGKMSQAWRQTAESLEKDRQSKFKEFFNQDFFEPQKCDPSKSCEVCGNRHLGKEETRCSTCRQLEDLGKWIRDSHGFLNIWGEKQEADRIQAKLNLDRSVSFETLGVHTVFLPESKVDEISSIHLQNGEFVILNPDSDLLLNPDALPQCSISRMYLGKWEKKTGQELDFQKFAEQAKGISRMGVLRMDVDNLGKIFVYGLNFPEREKIKGCAGWGDVLKDENGKIVRRPMASISRIATLSRQLNNFFSGYLSSLLQNDTFNRCRIIYSGGDDLMIIGSWDQLPDLARRIQRDFSIFCCDNSDMTISGGMSLHRGKYPVYKASQQAGEAETQAKNLRSSWFEVKSNKKGGFCFVNTALLWEDWPNAQKIKEDLEQEFKESRDKGLLSFLSSITAKNKNLVQNMVRDKNINQSQAWYRIEYYPWRWRTVYKLKRRYGRDEQGRIEQWSRLLFNSGEHNPSKDRYSIPALAWLEFPLRWVEFLLREKGDRL